MPTKSFDREVLKEALWGDDCILVDEDTSGRWNIYQTHVVPLEGKHYFVETQVGATECQECDRFFDNPGPIECREAILKEVTVKKWVTATND